MTKPTAQQIKEIKNLITQVPKDFDPNDKTQRGHTKYNKFNVNGVTLCYKPNKPLQIEFKGVPKFDLGTILSKKNTKMIEENRETLKMLYLGLSGSKAQEV